MINPEMSLFFMFFSFFEVIQMLLLPFSLVHEPETGWVRGKNKGKITPKQVKLYHLPTCLFIGKQ